jgi:alkylation response protein AidB-like acyl-CoA dehydrogenase
MSVNPVLGASIGAPRKDPLEIARHLSSNFRQTAHDRDKVGGAAKPERDQLRQSGLLSLIIPEAYGGWGATFPVAFDVVKEIATSDGSLGHIFGYHLLLQLGVELLGNAEQAARFYREAAQRRWFVGNASSENNSHVRDWKTTASATAGGGYLLNGVKHFCSGSVDADQLFVFGVIDGDPALAGAIVTAMIPSDREGVQINGDWDAIGMRQTDSGGVVFRNVEVLSSEVLGQPNAIVDGFFDGSLASLWTPAVQLMFSFMYLGVAEGALAEAVEYTRTRSRPWSPAGVQRAIEDPYILARYGEFAVQLQGANAAAREAANALQQIWDQGAPVTPRTRGELMVNVSGVKALATRAALEITSGIFEVMGARSSYASHGFDRFWRKVRTHTLHDPVSYKIRDVGDYTLNGVHPTPGFTS